MTKTPFNGVWRRVRLQILERDRWRCQIRGPTCTGEATQVDHIIPWRAGGSWYDEANLRAACRSCNNGRVIRRRRRVPSREW